MKITENIYIIGSGRAGFFTTNQYDCTVYLICDGDEYAIIDGGCGIEPELIMKNITNYGFHNKQCIGIFLTHGHADHSGGANYLMKHLNCVVYGLETCALLVNTKDIEKLGLIKAIAAGVYPRDYIYQGCHVVTISETDTFKIGMLEMSVLSTDGHCKGHAAYHVKGIGIDAVFVGDLLFHDGKISLQPLWDCNIDDYISSIEKLNRLEFQSFFPSHYNFSVRNGKENVKIAIDRLQALSLPVST